MQTKAATGNRKVARAIARSKAHLASASGEVFEAIVQFWRQAGGGHTDRPYLRTTNRTRAGNERLAKYQFYRESKGTDKQYVTTINKVLIAWPPTDSSGDHARPSVDEPTRPNESRLKRKKCGQACRSFSVMPGGQLYCILHTRWNSPLSAPPGYCVERNSSRIRKALSASQRKRFPWLALQAQRANFATGFECIEPFIVEVVPCPIYPPSPRS